MQGPPATCPQQPTGVMLSAPLQALLPNMAHQHSKVRLALLSGLRALVLSGLPAGLVQSQLAPAIKPLTFDRAGAVREAYYAAVASWLGSQHGQQKQDANADTAPSGAAAAGAAHARCRTYAPVLLPLLLLGISDSQDSIAAATLAAVEEIGAAWQQQEQGPSMPAACGQLDSATPMETDEQQATPAQGPPAAAACSSADLAVSAAAVATAQLPPPFHGLPSMGCRRMVANLLPQLLPGILSGLKEWTASLRSAAARCVGSQALVNRHSGNSTYHLCAGLVCMCHWWASHQSGCPFGLTAAHLCSSCAPGSVATSFPQHL